MVLRSKNINGPYEAKTVLAQGNTEINGPHQGAWVDTASGKIGLFISKMSVHTDAWCIFSQWRGLTVGL